MQQVTLQLEKMSLHEHAELMYKLDSTLAKVFDEHGYRTPVEPLTRILDAPKPVKITGGVLHRAMHDGSWHTDIDVFCNKSDIRDVAEYISKTFGIPIMKAGEYYSEYFVEVVHVGTVIDVVGVHDFDTLPFDMSIITAWINNDRRMHFPVGFWENISSWKKGGSEERKKKYAERGVRFL